MSEPVVPSVPRVNGVSGTGTGTGNGHANGDGHANGNGRVNGNGHAPYAAETVEFSGSSDETIAEAVREAMACASRTLRTLDGAGIRVIPQLPLDQGGPRFRVTLRITAPSTTPI